MGHALYVLYFIQATFCELCFVWLCFVSAVFVSAVFVSAMFGTFCIFTGYLDAEFDAVR